MKRRSRGQLYPPVEREHALSIGLDEVEWQRIVERLGRPPNEIECAVFAALWSEEFSYKSSAALLETIERKDPRVKNIAGSEIGVIDMGGGKSLVLRIVANNNQSHIESFLATQTCLDLALEDLVVTGATPLAVLNMLRFGPPDQSENQQRFIGALGGLASYSNTFGLPIIGGELYFHDRYNKGGLVNACAVALVDTEFRNTKIDLDFGSMLIYAGSETGNDGISSHTSSVLADALQQEEKSPSIVASDALLSSRLTAALSEAFAAGIPAEVTTVGPGGLATACFRMANRIRKPVVLEVNRIPLRVETMAPKDILLSETSDRLLIAVPKKKHRKLANIFDKWDVSSLMVGEVADADGLTFLWNHYVIADIPFHFALAGSVQKTFDVVKFPPMLRRSDADAGESSAKRQRKRDDDWEIVREASEESEVNIRAVDIPTSLSDTWLDLLADPNLCSRKPLYERFDQFVGANTVIGAGSDAAVLRLKDEVNRDSSDSDKEKPPRDRSVLRLDLSEIRGSSKILRGLALSVDSNSLYVSMEPYLGTVQTVAEGMRNLAATGARPIGLAYSLNFGDPNRYRDVCDLSESIRGLGDASRIWDIPILSKNVSLFNMSEGNSVLPTPAVAMVGVLDDVSKACNLFFRNKGDRILLIGSTKNEFGCSEYAHYTHGRVNRLVPDIDFEGEKKVCEFMCSLIEKDLVDSAHDLSAGGLAVALSECCLMRPRPIGAVLFAEQTLPEDEQRPDAILFSETSGRFLVSCSVAKEKEVHELCKQHEIPITAQGEVGGKEICIQGAADCSVSLQTAYRIWSKRMSQLLEARLNK